MTMLSDREQIARAQAAFSASAAQRSVEWQCIQRQSDADRRHEQRLIALGEAIRAAVVSKGEVFAADADVPAMAAAALDVYERQHGQ
jgi:hypothetical protein